MLIVNESTGEELEVEKGDDLRILFDKDTKFLINGDIDFQFIMGIEGEDNKYIKFSRNKSVAAMRLMAKLVISAQKFYNSESDARSSFWGRLRHEIEWWLMPLAEKRAQLDLTRSILDIRKFLNNDVEICESGKTIDNKVDA